MRAELFTSAVVILLVSGAVQAQPDKSSTPAQLSVWNTKAAVVGGPSRKVTVFGGNPNEFLVTCRCIAGMWQIAKGGESATQFTGTVQALSANHSRGSAKKLAVKVRKTRDIMYVLGEHRSKLHAILRGSGQVLLREVTGGEWEVAGYADEALGDVFANNSHWRADPKKPPKAGAPSAILDPLADGIALAKLINEYRVSIKLPRLPISIAMTKVAEAHTRDLNDNKPVKTGCNMHSWSTKGTWTACCYDGSTAAAKCMWSKPKEIGGYRGNGYEIAASFPAGMTPELALSQWQNSPLHHEVMINRGKWTTPWGVIGVAVNGEYAVAWFGREADSK